MDVSAPKVDLPSLGYGGIDNTGDVVSSICDFPVLHLQSPHGLSTKAACHVIFTAKPQQVRMCGLDTSLQSQLCHIKKVLHDARDRTHMEEKEHQTPKMTN